MAASGSGTPADAPAGMLAGRSVPPGAQGAALSTCKGPAP